MPLALSVDGGFISDFAADAEVFAGDAEAFIGFVEFSVVVRGSVATAGGPGEVAANGGGAVRVLPEGPSGRVVADTGADGVVATGPGAGVVTGGKDGISVVAMAGREAALVAPRPRSNAGLGASSGRAPGS
jgi:hypothetical protein